MSSSYEIAVYYFPNYHTDARNVKLHGPGWTEWDLVRSARPRFHGHQQPKVPAWGYTDEADPRAMAHKIDAAADHAVTAWIFDWYWYDDGPFLQRALDEGFLGAANSARLKFALMWANHDWTAIHPASRIDRALGPRLLYPGLVKEPTWSTIMDFVIDRYFRHPSYWLIAGRPYFSVYELGTLVRSAGGAEQARGWLEEFRRRTRAAGFPDLHLNAVIWGRPLLPGESAPSDPAALAERLGFDSMTSYVWVHYGFPGSGQTADYDAHRDHYFGWWEREASRFRLPYYPNVSMGWDSSPRCIPTEPWDPSPGYPYTPIVTGNTPDAFRSALRLTRARIERSSGPRRITINAWNEWTEGSYLEPDTTTGYGYLEAIRREFGDPGTADE